MIKEINISLQPAEASDREAVERALRRKLGPGSRELNDWRVARRSIDARRKPVIVNLGLLCALGADRKLPSPYEKPEFPTLPADAPRMVIVGAGPAGLFAALRAIQLGWRPVVLERGKDVDSRRADLAALCRDGKLDPDSNYSFGEGGAGTFSDGKLYTRSKKRGNVGSILSILHHFGADASILTDAHPHIGSDRLPHIIKAIRQRIQRSGGEVRFGSKVTGLLLEEGREGRRAVGVRTESGETFEGPVVLATGHSARDVYRFLDSQQVGLEAKGLAIGVRLEHPQKTIDSMQYHTPQGRGPWLPPAEYSFVRQVDGRGVYSFCMCPGGVVVPASTSEGEFAVNGMSASSRSSIWANSGMVVELHPGDIPGFSEHGPFEMMELQRSLEQRFAQAGLPKMFAPAQRMKDFAEGKLSSTLPPSSYLPGVAPARVDLLLPPFISSRLQQGFREFGKRARGFLTNDALVVGLESRTSSPVRIPRDRETLEHVSLPGLYPVGEGAGYAGGIVSAAMDGVKAAEAIAGHRTDDSAQTQAKPQTGRT